MGSFLTTGRNNSAGEKHPLSNVPDKTTGPIGSQLPVVRLSIVTVEIGETVTTIGRYQSGFV